MAPEMSGNGLLLKVDPIADGFRGEIMRSLGQRPRPPRLVGILSTSAAPCRSYAELTKKQCLSLGFDFVLKEIGAAANSELANGDGVEEAIIEANGDDNVDGIMVTQTRCRTLVAVIHSDPLGLLPDIWRATGMNLPASL
jgi:methylenetetrahydrofolate dehydrogenase (NAD+)